MLSLEGLGMGHSRMYSIGVLFAVFVWYNRALPLLRAGRLVLAASNDKFGALESMDLRQ